MCKRKGCKHCDFYYRDDDELTDCPRNFESDQSSIIIITVILTILVFAFIFMIYSILFGPR